MTRASCLATRRAGTCKSFVSVILLHPLSADRTDYEHVMLVPADRIGDTAHWDKSWALIEDTVFQREDLWVCEQAQRGLAAGTTGELVFGELESARARTIYEIIVEDQQ
jgi:hypothetical protein